MPYLHAVLKEALRVHPAFTTPMYRTVPSSGLVLPDGEFVPAGTEIGISQWVLHFDQDIFGEDAADFRPERWLEAPPEVLARREANFAGFGLGRRTCIGRQLAMFQLSKLVPEVLRRYQVKWAGDEKGWQVGGGVFAKQRGVVVRMEQRA
jgi:cytochrome P450